MRIGFIGLGIMGSAMVRHLLHVGHQVTVWNRTLDKVTALEQEGACVAQSPRTLAAVVEVVITCVTNTTDVLQVLLGSSGVVEGASPGLVVIDMSTISPRMTRQIAAALEQRGIAMLDAPVTGGERGALQATLSIMVGGKRAVLDRVLPILSVLGTKIVHVGDHGAGQTMKACNQILCAVTMVGVCEAIALCRKSGLDPQQMLAVTEGGAGGSWTLTHLAPKILAGDMDPAFMIGLMQKDLGIVAEVAQEAGVPLFGTPLAQELFAKVADQGGARLGTQAMIKAWEDK